jgi:hypothetical protein
VSKREGYLGFFCPAYRSSPVIRNSRTKGTLSLNKIFWAFSILNIHESGLQLQGQAVKE